jgi:formiminotetrahydrofolate cyclodeaminase
MLRGQRLDELLAAIGARTPAPASGAAVALTAALAAALAELAARYAQDEAAADRARGLVSELLELGDEDAAAYTAYMAERNEETRAEIVRVPQEIAARAEEAVALADSVRGRLRPAVAGDAEVAAELGRAAAGVARRLVEINRRSSGS